MIVSCPGCQTRYHWHAAAGGRAVCDRCEAQVPLVPSRPTYVVRVEVAGLAAVPRGSAASVAVQEPPPGRAPAARAGVAAAPGRAARPAPTETVLPLTQAALGLARRPARAAPALEEPADRDEPEAASRRKPARARPRSLLRRALQLLGTVVLGAGGVAAGHYAMMNGWIASFSVHPAVQPVDPRLAGGLLGVMLAWLVVRWTSPRS